MPVIMIVTMKIQPVVSGDFNHEICYGLKTEHFRKCL
jgi:hypothetical protein